MHAEYDGRRNKYSSYIPCPLVWAMSQSELPRQLPLPTQRSGGHAVGSPAGGAAQNTGGADHYNTGGAAGSSSSAGHTTPDNTCGGCVGASLRTRRGTPRIRHLPLGEPGRASTRPEGVATPLPAGAAGATSMPAEGGPPGVPNGSALQSGQVRPAGGQARGGTGGGGAPLLRNERELGYPCCR